MIDPTTLYRDIRFSKDLSNGTIIINKAEDWSKKETTRKPWCVFHVGPPKTASTALQQDFTEFDDNKYLSLDNYTYSGLCWRNGSFCDRGKFLAAMNKAIKGPSNTSCIQKVMSARQQYMNNITRTAGAEFSSRQLYNVLYKVDCPEFKTLLDMLNDMHSHGMSLVVSEEQMSYGLGMYSRVWNLLHETMQDSWNFGILVGYRRWMDFLPSRHWQDQLNKRGWYNWVGEGETKIIGRHVDPLFPTLNGVEKEGRFIDSLLTKLKRHTNLPIRIFNMNAATPTLSLRSILFCHVFPHMDTCCQQSLLLDRSSRMSNNANIKLSVGVVGAAKSFDYDMLTVAAKVAGLLHPELVRNDVTDAAREFHKSLSSSSPTLSDFAQICPSTREMEAFLNISLAKELAIMPKLHEHPLFGQDQHREKFWKAVEQKKYCSIDTNATLEQDEWKQFFANLQPPSG